MDDSVVCVTAVGVGEVGDMVASVPENEVSPKYIEILAE